MALEGEAGFSTAITREGEGEGAALGAGGTRGAAGAARATGAGEGAGRGGGGVDTGGAERGTRRIASVLLGWPSLGSWKGTIGGGFGIHPISATAWSSSEAANATQTVGIVMRS